MKKEKKLKMNMFGGCPYCDGGNTNFSNPLYEAPDKFWIFHNCTDCNKVWKEELKPGQLYESNQNEGEVIFEQNLEIWKQAIQK